MTKISLGDFVVVVLLTVPVGTMSITVGKTWHQAATAGSPDMATQLHKCKEGVSSGSRQGYKPMVMYFLHQDITVHNPQTVHQWGNQTLRYMSLLAFERP